VALATAAALLEEARRQAGATVAPSDQTRSAWLVAGRREGLR
jgi:hypothetical protein